MGHRDEVERRRARDPEGYWQRKLARASGPRRARRGRAAGIEAALDGGDAGVLPRLLGSRLGAGGRRGALQGPGHGAGDARRDVRRAHARRAGAARARRPGRGRPRDPRVGGGPRPRVPARLPLRQRRHARRAPVGRALRAGSRRGAHDRPGHHRPVRPRAHAAADRDRRPRLARALGAACGAASGRALQTLRRAAAGTAHRAGRSTASSVPGASARPARSPAPSTPEPSGLRRRSRRRPPRRPRPRRRTRSSTTRRPQPRRRPRPSARKWSHDAHRRRPAGPRARGGRAQPRADRGPDPRRPRRALAGGDRRPGGVHHAERLREGAQAARRGRWTASRCSCSHDSRASWAACSAGGFLAVRGAHTYGTFVLAEPDGAVHLHDKDIPTAWEQHFYLGGDDPGVTRCETLGCEVGLMSGWEWARFRTSARVRAGGVARRAGRDVLAVDAAQLARPAALVGRARARDLACAGARTPRPGGAADGRAGRPRLPRRRRSRAKRRSARAFRGRRRCSASPRSATATARSSRA